MVQKHRGESARSQEQEESTSEVPVEQIGSAAVVGAQAESTLEDIDALLDELDKDLEENAEEFVANFVQKGGQ